MKYRVIETENARRVYYKLQRRILWMWFDVEVYSDYLTHEYRCMILDKQDALRLYNLYTRPTNRIIMP
jgi:hypothetical protein